jgi:CheY-like chemotaxis protein
VLVVDDNRTSREILQGMLESMSFEVFQAASAKEGLEELERAGRTKPFDLVLMDWQMPGMDGLKASSLIKNHMDLSKIPAVIMVTAYGREEIMKQAEQIGLEGFLIKPVSPSLLLDAIMSAFGKEPPKAPARREAGCRGGGFAGHQRRQSALGGGQRDQPAGGPGNLGGGRAPGRHRGQRPIGGGGPGAGIL